MSEFKLRSGSATPFKLMGSSPAKTTHPISPSEKQDIADVKVITTAVNPNKPGGEGSATEDQPIVRKSKRRQIIRDKDELSRKELLESSKQAHLTSGGKGGSKSTVTGGRSWLKRAFTSTKKLKSEDTVRQLRTASAKGQAAKIKT